MAGHTDEDLTTLYVTYGPMVLRRARAILGNDADAEDVVQDVFQTVIRKLPEFRGDASIGTWMYQITTRTCIDRIRSAHRRERLDEKLDPTTQNGASMLDIESTSLLHQVLRKVPRDLAAVAVYHYVDGMTQEEISTVLGCSRRKVGYLLEKFHARAGRIVRDQ